jgi:DNA-binding protein HU-beta
VNKAELVEKVRNATQLSKSQAESAVDEVLQSVIGAVKSGERVSIFGFGTFNPTSRAARTGRNPQTGEPVKIGASKSVRFAPAGAFKSALNARRAGKRAAPAKTVGRPSKATGKATGKKAPAATKAAKSTKKR